VPGLAVVVQQQRGSTSSSEAKGQRQGCGGGSASEQQAGGGFEHWRVTPVLYPVTIQQQGAAASLTVTVCKVAG
jgi:hypothetical protein